MRIEIENLSFQYKSSPLFTSLNMSIEKDQWVGILGPNGAGKTTFLKLIVGLLPPQSGSIRLGSLENTNPSLRRAIGTSLQEIDFPENIRVSEIIEFVGAHYENTVPLSELVRDFFLEEFLHKKCGALSGGMKRRLSLALAMMGKAKVLLLDEPTTGLDQLSRRQLLQNIERHRRLNRSLILMISHHPEDLTQHVDQFLILKSKQQPKWVPPETLSRLVQSKQICFHCPSDLNFQTPCTVKRDGSDWKVTSEQTDTVVKELVAQSSGFKNLRIEPLSLETMYEDYL